MDFAKIVRSCREELQLTQAELGKRVGVYRTTVIEWEKGRTIPTNAKVRRSLARTLNVKYEDLFGETDELDEMLAQQAKVGIDFRGLRKSFRFLKTRDLRYWEQVLQFVAQNSILTTHYRHEIEKCRQEIERVWAARKPNQGTKKNTQRGGGKI